MFIICFNFAKVFQFFQVFHKFFWTVIFIFILRRWLLVLTVIFLAHKVSKRYFTKMSEALNKIQEVDIDPNGVFKYILIEIKDKDAVKKIVRGYSRCDYHGE